MAKRKNVLKKVLVWWLLGSVLIAGISHLVFINFFPFPSRPYDFLFGGSVGDFRGLLLGILWFLSFSVIGTVYLYVTSRTYKRNSGLFMGVIGIILIIFTIYQYITPNLLPAPNGQAQSGFGKSSTQP